jgi:hypothetical protein
MPTRMNVNTTVNVKEIALLYQIVIVRGMRIAFVHDRIVHE